MRAVILSAAATCGFAADEALPKPESILDKYIEVTGGKTRYQELTTQLSSGTFEAPDQGISGTMAAYRAAPNKL